MTFVSTDNISLQIVDYMYLTPISYVYVENEQSNTCVHIFLSYSGNLTSCSELILGKKVVLISHNALLEIIVSNTHKSACDKKTNATISNNTKDCLISEYDSVYKKKSLEKDLHPFEGAINFNHYEIRCPVDCKCTLGKSDIIQDCTCKTITSLIIYEPYVKALSFSEMESKLFQIMRLKPFLI